MLTREELSALTNTAAESDSVRFRKVTYETLRNLESGFVRPRTATARTLSHVLRAEIEELFPAGVDHGTRRS